MVNVKKIFAVFAVLGVCGMFSEVARADSVAVLRQGLLGAGTGAIATAASGAKGDRIWQGALIGAGVNVVGGALLDMITGQRVGPVYVSQPQQTAYVSQPAAYAQAQYVPAQYSYPRPDGRFDRRAPERRAYRAGYIDGYRDGYRYGYNGAMYYL